MAMRQKEILEKCLEKGIKYSYVHIHRLGVKYGFFKREDGSKRKFIESEFYKWLDSVNVSIPSDCVFIKDAVKKYNIDYNIFKYHFEKEGVEVKVGGYEFGGMNYAKKSDIERVVAKYHKSVAKGEKKHD